MSDLATKLKKLWALAQDSDSEEARSAARMYESLIALYGVDEALLRAEERLKRPFPIKCGVPRKMLQRICTHLGIGLYYRTWHRRRHFFVECTDAEEQVIKALLMHSGAVYLARKHQQALELRSFLFGHLDSAYPCADKNLDCPKCGKMAYDFNGERFVCRECGHKSRRVSVVHVDPFAYREGQATGRPPLAAPTQPEAARA